MKASVKKTMEVKRAFARKYRREKRRKVLSDMVCMVEICILAAAMVAVVGYGLRY